MHLFFHSHPAVFKVKSRWINLCEVDSTNNPEMQLNHPPMEAYPIFLAAKYEMAKVAKATTLIELMGIRMAATNGESVPCTAKEIPTTL